MLVIGVNGVGKTTTIGKLAHQPHRRRARKSCSARPIPSAPRLPSSSKSGPDAPVWTLSARTRAADPAAVVFDAISAAKARGSDVILVRHGRTPAQQGQPDERARQNFAASLTASCRMRIKRSCSCSTATTGQNGLLQAKQFKEIAGVTGHRPDKTRRHGQGRHRHRRGGRAADPCEAHRCRRTDGRPDAV